MARLGAVSTGSGIDAPAGAGGLSWTISTGCDSRSGLGVAARNTPRKGCVCRATPAPQPNSPP
eukprot:7384281-Prymnesium_polylepis.1